MNIDPKQLLTLCPENRRFEKFWNTYLRFPLPWMFRRAPHRHWEQQQLGDKHGPDKFIELTESSHVLLAEIERLTSDPEAPILDLGCNAGRHLNSLWLKGFRNLHGLDVQHAALAHMAELFPAMKAGSSISQGTFQEFLPTVRDRAYEVVFTHGATVELVPPSFPICTEIARVAKRGVVLVINENGHYYPRFWEKEFLRAGFLMTKLIRPVSSSQLASLMVFLRLEDIE